MIDLTGLTFAAIQPELLEYGGIQRGALGGPSQNLQRLGNRFSFALALPPLPASNVWTGKIVAAKQEGALIRIVEPGFAGIVWPTLPTVAAAVAGGTTVTVQGLAAGFATPPKWISFIHGGRRYAHLIVAATVANGAGVSTFTISPMLRTPLSAGDTVEIASPKAEGLLVDQLGWGVDSNRLINFTLKLEEQR
jgi:hypothetical protein